jgi:hypothetical protein
MNRYSNIKKTKSPDGNQIYRTVRYPDIPRSVNDTYVYTTIGDRFDTLAQQYYGNSSLWWIISISNDNLNQNSLTPPVGSQIRIPSDYSNIISRFKVLNK